MFDFLFFFILWHRLIGTVVPFSLPQAPSPPHRPCLQSYNGCLRFQVQSIPCLSLCPHCRHFSWTAWPSRLLAGRKGLSPQLTLGNSRDSIRLVIALELPVKWVLLICFLHLCTRTSTQHIEEKLPEDWEGRYFANGKCYNLNDVCKLIVKSKSYCYFLKESFP